MTGAPNVVQDRRRGSASPMTESTTDYRQIFESTPGLFLVVRPDASFAIVNASHAYLRATFTQREQIVERGLFDVLPDDPEHAEATAMLRASLARVAATGESETMPVQKYDLFRPNADGEQREERFWSAVNTPVLSPEGKVLFIIHRTDDVTEFVRSTRAMQHDGESMRLEILHRGREVAAANRQLREAVAQFQAVYDQGLFAGRLDLDGKVVDVNRSALEQCGYTRTDVLGKPFWECGWWNRSAAVQAWVRNGVEQAIRGETFRGVSTYYWSDGSERVVDFACMPIKDESDEVVFVFPTGMDITERVAAERNLRASDILESITDGFFALDREWRFTYINMEGQRILGRGGAVEHAGSRIRLRPRSPLHVCQRSAA
jgi:PAS domain S-box-containing protein